MNDFIYMCAICGVADTIYKNEKFPPKWMNQKERKAWYIGANYAKQQFK